MKWNAQPASKIEEQLHFERFMNKVMLLFDSIGFP